MTRMLPGEEIARRINESLPGAAIRFNQTDVWVTPESLLDVTRFLKETHNLEFSFLTSLMILDAVLLPLVRVFHAGDHRGIPGFPERCCRHVRRAGSAQLTEDTPTSAS